ncbi:unnamed protein product [Urochloa humidicola]
MALVKKKGIGVVLLVAAFMVAILLPAASVYSSLVMSPSRRQQLDARYQIYTIYLRKPPNAEAMDEDVHRRWHKSFLPSTLTDSGKPRLLTSHYSVRGGIYYFTARLTVAELAVAAKKPRFLKSRYSGRRKGNRVFYVVRRSPSAPIWKVASFEKIARIVKRFLM